MPSTGGHDLGNAELSLNVARIFKFLLADYVEEYTTKLSLDLRARVRAFCFTPQQAQEYKSLQDLYGQGALPQELLDVDLLETRNLRWVSFGPSDPT